MIRISVIGSGYVGLVAAACFAELGHQVTCIDNDSNRVAALQRGEIPIYEQFLPDLLQRHRGGRLRFTRALAEPLRDSQVIFIAVGTPSSDSGQTTLSSVRAVARAIAPLMATKLSVVNSLVD